MIDHAMANSRRKYSTLIGFLSFLFVGGSIGWLAGLSVSPIIQAILASLLGVVGAVAAAMAGIKEEKQVLGRINPLPLAALFVGLALGASLGVHARTAKWLEASLHDKVQAWEEYGVLSREVIVQRFFDLTYPAKGAKAEAPGEGEEAEAPGTGASIPADLAPYLFAAQSGECKELLTEPDDILRRRMRGADNELIKATAEKTDDLAALRGVVRAVCLESE